MWIAAADSRTTPEPGPPAARVTVKDRAEPAALRARVSVALHGDGPVRELPAAADAALVALAAAGGIRSVVSRKGEKTFRCPYRRLHWISRRPRAPAWRKPYALCR